MDLEKIDLNWLRLAMVNGLERSKDPRTKLGACIVSEDGRQVSFGYNGFPSGFPDTEENWAPPKKYEIVIHAEMNAILNCQFSMKNATLYCPLQPCHRCMSHICNSGISRLVYFNNLYELRQSDQQIFDALLLFGGLKSIQSYKVDEKTKKIFDLYNNT